MTDFTTGHRPRIVAAVTALLVWMVAGVAGTDAVAASSDDALVQRGAYLTNAGGCLACHSRPGGKPFAGGLSIATPFGTVTTPNITPDNDTGIGSWTDDEFYRAMHEGIGRKGEYLYPVMPFPWYSIVTRDDVLAIKAYLFAQPAVRQVRLANKLSFPYSIRASLLAWREAFFKPQTFVADPGQSAEVNRGAYLVNGLTHCGECHNGRPVAGTSKFRQALQGGVIDNWYAPNISADVRDGIGGWSQEEIARYLKTGSAPGKSVAVGPMAETIHALAKLSDEDRGAIAAYLKTTQPKSGKEQKTSLFAGRDARGADTYLNYCASCHGASGEGLAGAVPGLNGNGAVTAIGPQNVIQVVLGGLQARAGYGPMPAIGAGMSDQEVADVTNYVRQTWANAAPPTALPGQVAALREHIDTPMHPGLAASCPRLASATLAARLGDVRSGLARQLRSVSESNMPQSAERLVTAARRLAPRSKSVELVNDLGAAYCSVLTADRTLDRNQRALRLGQFSQLVYATAQGQALH